MKSESMCAFTGHRGLPRETVPLLRERLTAELTRLHTREGYSTFLAGGAIGFDRLAAETVLTLRARYPGMRLRLILPFPGYDQKWPAALQQGNSAILRAADEMIYAAPAYFPEVYHLRDRMLVDEASLLVAWLTRPSGGTYYTVSYAYDRGCPIINLAKPASPYYTNH